MASCTIVSSRCVAGLSTGMRAFSASATMMKRASPSASEHAQTHSRECHVVGDGGELRRARDQRDRQCDHQHCRFRQARRSSPRATHRCRRSWCRYPSPPTPTKRAEPSSAVIAIRSPDQLNSKPVAKVGTSAAATHVTAKTTYGAATRNSHYVFGQHHLLAQQALQGHGYGWISGGPCTALQPRLHLAHQPGEQRASSRSSVICAPCTRRPWIIAIAPASGSRITRAAKTKPR